MHGGGGTWWQGHSFCFKNRKCHGRVKSSSVFWNIPRIWGQNRGGRKHSPKCISGCENTFTLKTFTFYFRFLFSEEIFSFLTSGGTPDFSFKHCLNPRIIKNPNVVFLPQQSRCWFIQIYIFGSCLPFPSSRYDPSHILAYELVLYILRWRSRLWSLWTP